MSRRLHPMRCSALSACGLLLVLMAVPCVLGGLVWREWHQERLDQALIVALETHHTAMALTLLHSGADPNGCASVPSFLTRFLDTALHTPVRKTRAHAPPLLLAVQVPLSGEAGNAHVLFDENEEENTEEATQLVALLLAKGANSNGEDENGKTPLIWAAAEGRTTIMRQLLAQGAAVNKQDKAGGTALHYAVYEENLEAAHLLLDCQATPNLRDTDGFTPLDTALHIHHYKPVEIIEMLTKAEAQEKSKALPSCAFQTRLDADLLQAQEEGQYARMAMLLRRGADPDTKVNIYGRTALMQAAGWGGEEEIALLAKCGANVDAQDEDGATALMYAISKGRDENVRALLTCHANITLHNKEGRTALQIAQEFFACNAITPFLHIEAETRRKFWQQMIRALQGHTQYVEGHLRPGKSNL